MIKTSPAIKLNLTLVTSLWMLLAANSSAQDSTFTEIGLNATPFVNQYLDFGDDDNEVVSPYMFTYERRFGKVGFRTGLGFGISGLNQQPENGEPTEPEFHTSSQSIDFRAGIVRYKNLSRRWDLKYGIDAIVSSDNSKNWTIVRNLFGEEVKTTNTNLNWFTGVSPFFFAQFHLTEHFSVGTEILARFTYGELVTKTENTEFPDFNTRQESRTYGTGISAPTSLFFIFRF